MTAATSCQAKPLLILVPPSSSRELDLGVFAVLHYGPLSRTLLDSEEHTKERETVALKPASLLLLLRDLNSKLGAILSPFRAKVIRG